LNARSIVNKIAEFYYLIYSHRYDIIFVVETWLKDYITNGFTDPKGAYRIIRYDRSSAKGGGVCVLISKAYTVNEVKINDCYADLEICCFDVLSGSRYPACRFLTYTGLQAVSRTSLLIG